ncbi:MAG: double-strand break repair protein AddB [Rickettsiales endosymbiont of Dermacentor nuttalli]
MIYHIPPNFLFLDSLAFYVIKQYGHDSEILGNIQIFLPSRRAVHILKEKLLKYSGQKALILPRICPIGDIGTEEFPLYSLDIINDMECPNVLNKLQRNILFTKLLLEHVHTRQLNIVYNSFSDLGSYLAEELINLLDEMYKMQLDIQAAINLIIDEMDASALHWQDIKQLLNILSIEWPKLLQEKNFIDPIAYRNLITQQLINYWQKNPYPYPVIAAGSTASTKITATLLKAIDALPYGKVIIPSLDLHISDQIWQEIDELHPQYYLKNLLEYLNYNRSDVKLWPGCIDDFLYTNDNRIRLLSEIMLSYKVPNNWYKFSPSQYDYESIKGIRYIVCDNLSQEANIIAMIMRHVLETSGKTAALVTNDENLSRSIMFHLKQWDITIDNSSGKRLVNAPVTIYFRLILDVINKDFQLVPLLVLLKHHLTLLGYDKIFLEQIVIRLECNILRVFKIKPGLKGLLESIKSVGDEELYELISRLKLYMTKFLKIRKRKTINFGQILDEHILLTESLTKGINNSIWETEDGQELAKFLLQLREYSNELGEIDSNSYTKIIYNFLYKELYFLQNKYSNRLAILTPIEARFHDFDLIILGGLNEGSWPELQKNSPILNKYMRSKIGLPLLEHKIGQAAHDFFTLMGTKEVVLTRSRKLSGTQTISSRFLLRLETVLLRNNLLHLIQDSRYLHWHKLLNTVTNVKPISPPVPCPPKELRPRKLSVTQIELLMQDPYAIYAKYILKLNPLYPLNITTAADFGNFVHNTLEYFSTKSYKGMDEEEIYNELIVCGKIIIYKHINNNAMYYLWWPRFERIANWFAKREKSYLDNDDILIFTETMGKMEIEFECGDVFTLTSKADRIEIIQGKLINIIDYKTGYIPDLNQVKNGNSPQLTLEGLIAKNNGFNCQVANKEYYISDLMYIDLSGDEEVGNIKSLNTELDEVIEKAGLGVRNLLKVFNNSNTPYLSCPLTERQPRYNYYIHLSRQKEWK